MKILDGLELVGYIKERQAKQVRALRQSWRVIPKLAIIRNGENKVIDTYVRLKESYGEDIGVEVDTYNVANDQLLETIEKLNRDDSVMGIIVQLPLDQSELTDIALGTVAVDKDVDGLGEASSFTPATPLAINWLLAGYNIELEGKKIAIVGKGRLVGAPLRQLWSQMGLDIEVCDSKTPDLGAALSQADVIVTATGVPGLIKSEMIHHGAVVIDAGTASEKGRIVGDLDGSVRDRYDLTVTPIKGGVGPLTVAALFDNVITAARKIADAKGQQDI